ncbi:lipoprotein [Helicobacter pylori CPY1962]|nr:lipoprotein [Helicobacter pylori CPY1962]
MKTYQKLLGASCLALYLVGCGSGGGGESPVEIEKNDFNSTLKIISKVDSVTIQGVKLIEVIVLLILREDQCL